MRITILLILAFALQGCASSLYQDISSADLQKVRASSIVIKYHETPPFFMMTPKSVVGEGLIADWTESSDLPLGQALVREYGIPDPTALLAAETMKTFAAKGIRVAAIDDDKLPLPVAEQPNFAGDKYDYILELNTPAWLANYLPFNWETYAFVVRGAGRLVRTLDQAIVWKGFCAHGGYDDERLELDVTEFEKDNAAKVKQSLEIASKSCASQLAEQITKSPDSSLSE